MPPKQRWGWLLLVVWLAGCGTSPAPTPLPTLTFAPPTITAIPPTPSATASPLPTAFNALDLITPEALPPIPVSLPKDAQNVLNAVLSDAADFWEKELDSIQVLGLKSMKWVDFTCDDLGIEQISSVDFSPAGMNGYRVIVGDTREALVYYTNSAGEYLRCDTAHHLDSYGDPLYVDPLAWELVELAQAELAHRLGADVRDIRPVDVVAVTWRDTSLGCPLPDQEYPAQTIAGYRILLKYRADYYRYHTDFLAPVFCPSDREEMPPPFEPTPTSTITPSPFPTAIPDN